jgi:hypothetical protein
MSMNFGIAVGRPGFERVSEAEGRQELQSLAYDDSLPAARTAKVAVPDARPAATAAPSPVVPAAVATAVVAQPAVAARPIESIPVPAAAVPPPSPAPRVAATAPSETAPFARTPLNDLRLLLQANR